jgi:hypothetical protein
MGEPLAQIPVIHWGDAMQQVGDDEEFLRELLADLRSETELQLQTIAAAMIQVLFCSVMYNRWICLSHCFFLVSRIPKTIPITAFCAPRTSSRARRPI